MGIIKALAVILVMFGITLVLVELYLWIFGGGGIISETLQDRRDECAIIAYEKMVLTHTIRKIEREQGR